MPTVPVGNKNIGEVAAVATYSVPSSLVKVAQLNAEVVALNKSTSYTPVNVNNKMIGEFSSVAIYTAMSSVKIMQLQACAVVNYDPPQSVKVAQVIAHSVVLDSNSTAVPAHTENKFVGELTAVATTNSVDYQKVAQLIAFVVVKEFHPRKEITTFDINYAADAQFNLEPNQ